MAIGQNWKNWILECLLKKVSPETIVTTMLDKGFVYSDIAACLGSNVPNNFRPEFDDTFYQKVADAPIWHLAQAEHLCTSPVQLLRIDNFLSHAECQHLITLSKSRLRPSTIAAKSGYEGYRTSSTCDLPYLNDDTAERIDQRIVDTVGQKVGTNEVIQAQHYAVGQQFKAHTDYFQPGAKEYDDFCQVMGQRTWTVMVYLNDECQGGETEFVRLGLKIKPKTGTALAWNNLLPNGAVNPDTLHHAHPVRSGEKVVITKWFRHRNA